jgi:hypothetical protein
MRKFIIPELFYLNNDVDGLNGNKLVKWIYGASLLVPGSKFLIIKCIT